MDARWNSSYVYGYDNFSGWEGRYFFTYFSEFGDRSSATIVIEAIILSITFVVSIIANLSIAYCVMK